MKISKKMLSIALPLLVLVAYNNCGTPYEALSNSALSEISSTDPQPIDDTKEPIKTPDSQPVIPTPQPDDNANSPIVTPEPPPVKPSPQPDNDKPTDSFSLQKYNIESIKETSIDITWQLSEGGSSQLIYGETKNLNLSNPPETTYNYSAHRQTVKNLQPDTDYYFQIISMNAKGTEINSEVFKVKTIAAIPQPDVAPEKPEPVITPEKPKPITVQESLGNGYLGNKTAVGPTVYTTGSVRYSKSLVESPVGAMGGKSAWLNSFGSLVTSDGAHRSQIPTNTSMAPFITQPDLFFYTSGTGLYEFNAATKNSKLLHTFPNNINIGEAEGIQSRDDRYIVLTDGNGSGNGVQMAYVYDRVANRILASISKAQIISMAKSFKSTGNAGVQPGEINWASMSPSGKYVVLLVESASGSLPSFGYLRLNRDLTNPKLLGYEKNGNIQRISPQHDAMFQGANGNDMLALLHWDSIIFLDLESPNSAPYATEVGKFGYGWISPFASYGRPGWVAWTADNGRVRMVKLDPSRYGSQLQTKDAEWISTTRKINGSTQHEIWPNLITGNWASTNLNGTRIYAGSKKGSLAGGYWQAP